MIPLSHGLNIDKWSEYVDIYNDHSLPMMLNYSFPSGHQGAIVPAVGLDNHASAKRNPKQVANFIDKEKTLGAMAGPFEDTPFSPWFRSNPLLTRPKRDSKELRVVLDLSFPFGAGINTGIAKNELDGLAFKLKLPTPLDLANLIVEMGRGCHLFKIDMSRAYRQLRGDPLDWPLMGVTWYDKLYVGLTIPFGLRHGA